WSNLPRQTPHDDSSKLAPQRRLIPLSVNFQRCPQTAFQRQLNPYVEDLSVLSSFVNNMPSILLSLPEEILLDIMGYLCKSDLCGLALVSSRLTAPAQSVLFRTIDLNLWSQWGSSPGNLHLFTNLVNTLSQKPRLRLSAWSLSIRAIHSSN